MSISASEFAPIITAFAALITAVAIPINIFISLKTAAKTKEVSDKVEKTVGAVEEVKVATQELHDSTNSKMDELLKQAKKASRLEGRVEGRESMRIEQAELIASPALATTVSATETPLEDMPEKTQGTLSVTFEADSARGAVTKDALPGS